MDIIWIFLTVVSLFTFLGWFLFKGAEGLGLLILLLMAASGLGFWIVMVTAIACEFGVC